MGEHHAARPRGRRRPRRRRPRRLPPAAVGPGGDRRVRRRVRAGRRPPAASRPRGARLAHAADGRPGGLPGAARRRRPGPRPDAGAAADRQVAGPRPRARLRRRCHRLHRQAVQHARAGQPGHRGPPRRPGVNSLAAPAAVATAVLGVLVVVLLVAVAAVHTTRARRRARRLAAAEENRAGLMALVHDLLDDGDPDAVTAAPPDLDEVLLHLLPQLRGADREAIQTALTRRGVVARAAADLDARAAWRRGRAATLLGSTAGRDHLARLTALLADRSIEVRCAAARALGRVGDPAAVHGLLAALTTARPLPAGVVGMAVLDLGT